MTELALTAERSRYVVTTCRVLLSRQRVKDTHDVRAGADEVVAERLCRAVSETIRGDRDRERPHRKRLNPARSAGMLEPTSSSCIARSRIPTTMLTQMTSVRFVGRTANATSCTTTAPATIQA